MPRTLDPILEAALVNIAGDPIFTGYLGYENGGIVIQSQCLKYKLTGATLEIEVEGHDTISGDVESIWLKRGLRINGIDYTITTSRFFIQSLEFTQNLTTIATGTILPRRYTSISGDNTYETIITNFCAQFGKTAVFKNPTDAYWDYQFLPTGKTVTLNDAMRFFNLLRQKYLIFACDYGNEEILFYHTKPILGQDHIIDFETNYFVKENRDKSRQFIWRDEAQTLHTDGNLTDPIHNLGYLESTATPPEVNTPWTSFNAIIAPNLKLLDGDILRANIISDTDPQVPTRVFIEEEFDPKGKAPVWKTIIKGNEVFGNTEGGAIPSTIERVSNYTPLNTSTFNGNLDSTINNLQALAEAVDDLPLGDIPILTADPVSPTDGYTYYLRQTAGAIADGVPIGLLLTLTYTGNSGTTLPLQLSVWDAVTNQTIRF